MTKTFYQCRCGQTWPWWGTNSYCPLCGYDNRREIDEAFEKLTDDKGGVVYLTWPVEPKPESESNP